MSSDEPMRGATSSKILSASGSGAERGRGPDDRGQQIDAGVDAPAAALDESVGVGDERAAGGSSTVASMIADG